MRHATASLRELRTNFGAVKRKIEEDGAVVLTDHGKPAYILTKVKRLAKIPDYYKRLLRRQPKSLTAPETQQFWQEERRET